MNHHPLFPYLVLACPLVVLFFQLVDMRKAAAPPLAYVALALMIIAMFLAYRTHAAVIAVVLWLVAGLTTAFLGDVDDLPPGGKIFMLNALVFSALWLLFLHLDPAHVHDLLMLHWFRPASLASFSRYFFWTCYFGMAYGIGLGMRQRLQTTKLMP